MISQWLNFDSDTLIIDHKLYGQCDPPSDLESALILQAQTIYKELRNPTVFVSGGIDSQSVAYGFIKAKLPVRFVNFKFMFDGKSCFSEQFYVREFFKKHETTYDTIEINHNRDSFMSLFERYDHFNTGRGLGILQLLDVYLKFMQDNPDATIVTGSGIFAFERRGDTCCGMIPHYNKGVTTSLPEHNVLSFYHYAPHVYRYYEHVHRNSFWLQYPVNFEPKNLAYTELGFDFRPKLAGWEQTLSKDYSELTTIDFGTGHDPVLDPKDSSHKSTMRAIGFSESEIEKLMKQRPQTTQYFDLYSFKSMV